jgi:hypothetical protein
MHPRFLPLQNGIEQLSDAWFKQRKGRVTGSKLSNFCFIKDEEEYHDYYSVVFEGKPKAPFTAQQLGYMEYGRKHEDVAVCAFLNDAPEQVGDIYISESPFYKHVDPGVGASPDGTYAIFSGKKIVEEGVVEIKCPGKSPNRPYTKWKYYYVPQTFWEMSCTGHRKTIAISWGPRNMRAWRYEWDDEYWYILCNIVKAFMEHVPYSEFSSLQADLIEASHRIADNATPLHSGAGWKQYAHKVEEIKKNIERLQTSEKRESESAEVEPSKKKQKISTVAKSFLDFPGRDPLWAEIIFDPNTSWYQNKLCKMITKKKDQEREFVVMKCENGVCTCIPGYSSGGEINISESDKVLKQVKFF